MMRPALTIARYTLLEAVRNRLAWLVLILMAGAVALSGFLNELALTESRQLQAALLAAMLRVAAVFLVATFVITSMAREASDKGLELLMALPLPRAVYLSGKLAGFAALALLPAGLFGALGLFFAPPAQAGLWAISLLCECWIVAAFSVLCMLTLSQVLPALAAAFSFYLLARAIGALQMLGHGAMAGTGTGTGAASSFGQQALNTGIDGLALLLPHLDQFTRSDWLVYHNGSGAELASIAAQTAIYVLLLGAAALFDLHRKNL